jgi:hypothetical protein
MEGGEEKPYRTRKLTVEEEVGIILHSSTGGTVIIYVVGEPVCSFSSG